MHKGLIGGLLFCFFLAMGFGKSVAVNVVPIAKGSLRQEESFVGNVVFKEIANIASQSSGIIQEVYFRSGQRVKKGEKLLSLSDEFLQKDIIIKQAKLEQAQYVLEKKKKELERYRNLLETQSIPLQQYENIEYELKSQEAAILALQAELDISILDLQHKVVYAPFDGIIVNQKVHKSEWVNTGEAICQILNTKDVEVVADVPSFMIMHLGLNQKVEVKVNNRNYKGNIVALIPKADISSRNFPVYISIKGDDMLLDGMPASIRLGVNQRNSGFLVPRDSVVQRMGKSGVFVIRDNKAVWVEVNVLAISRNQALIQGNLKEKEQLVFRGQDRLESGDEAKVIP